MKYGQFTPLFDKDEGASGDADSGKDNKDADKDGKDEVVTKTKGLDEAAAESLLNENNRLKREAAERSEKERKEKAKKQKEAGQHESRADEAEKRADDAETELAKLKRERVVEKAAVASGMEFPEDAIKFLSDDEMEDERAAEAGMRRLKTDRPGLFKEQKRSGGDINSEEDDDGDRPGTNQGSLPVQGLQRLRGVSRKT